MRAAAFSSRAAAIGTAALPMVKGEERGHFFCATIGDAGERRRVYLRFVPLDPEREIVSEIGTCLRLIECNEDNPAVVTTEMAEAAYGAWQRAREESRGDRIARRAASPR